jgi:hypothetical protein
MHQSGIVTTQKTSIEGLLVSFDPFSTFSCLQLPHSPIHVTSGVLHCDFNKKHPTEPHWEPFLEPPNWQLIVFDFSCLDADHCLSFVDF